MHPAYQSTRLINAEGDWLEQAGFPTGTEVNVSVMQGKLIIEQATE
ncbi:type I addiction module toxin, SymE family [Citrobacter freundii]|nr:type I addiction module toxin, SymE family [Citrobacter freundii]QLV43084.1 type I addiction module toxin, SymE family [Citrobacter freundii]